MYEKLRSTGKILYKQLSYEIQGAAIEVRRNFGSGHKENVYQNAFAEELSSRGIIFEREKNIAVISPKTGRIIGYYKPDFVVENKIIVELKAVDKTPRLLVDQVFDYLRNSEYELGYFINFAAPRLFTKRIIYTNDRKKSLINRLTALIILVAISPLLVAFSVPVSAATVKLYFGGPTALGVGSEFMLNVLADSDVPLNAYALELRYPSDRLTLESFDDSQSIIDVWQTRPTAYAGGTVALQGGSTKAFSGSGGKVIAIRFRVTAAGPANFSITNAAFYLADGRGTSVAPLAGSLVIDLSSSLPASGLARNTGAAPPEIQLLAIIADPQNNNKLLSFQVRGMGSGIDTAAVRYRTGFVWSSWQVVQNPAVLPANAWAVNFKVADLAGNISEETLYDWWNLLNYLVLPLLAVLTGAGLILGVVHRLRNPQVL